MATQPLSSGLGKSLSGIRKRMLEFKSHAKPGPVHVAPEDAAHTLMCRNADIPTRYRAATLENYIPRTPDQEAAKRAAAEYVRAVKENPRLPFGITLWGSVGAGKTYLACAVLAEVLRLGHRGYFTTEDRIFDRFKENWGAPEEEIRFLLTLQRRRFLVVDDLGIRRPSDYVSDRYEAIINARYAHGLPTILTSNRTPEQLSAAYERQMSRLSGNWALKVVGPDMRQEK